MADRASTYLGAGVVLALVAGGRTAAVWAFPLATLVCAYGVVETLLRTALPMRMRVASVVAHVALPLACVARSGGDARVRPRALLLATIVLVLTLGVYAAVGAWPYAISPARSALVVGALGLAMLPTRRA